MAESFGSDAARYDRTRPRYPEALIRLIAEDRRQMTVVDVGCGTGICARQLHAAGATVLGVEPDPRMAAYAQRSGIEVELSRWEEWDPLDRRFHAVVAGQTWHWVDPAKGARKAAGVLPGDGLFCVFWNAAQPPAELAAEFSRVYQRVAPGRLDPWAHLSSDAYPTFCAAAIDGVRQTAEFSEPRTAEYRWERHYTTDEWLDQLPTHGNHFGLPASTLDRLLEGIRAVLDHAGGSLRMSYATTVVTARRVPYGLERP